MLCKAMLEQAMSLTKFLYLVFKQAIFFMIFAGFLAVGPVPEAPERP